MLKHFHILKRAMRFYAAGEHPCALLELDAIIGTDKENDSSALFCLRGRVKQVRSRYPEAIADYMKALTIATPESLNQRNTLRILQNIIECSTRLDDNQRGPLHALLRKEFGLKKNDWFPLEMQFAPPSFRPERKPLPPRTPAPTGRIHNIGKFLLDARDLQKLASLVADPQASGVRRLTTYQSPEGTEMFGRALQLPPHAQQTREMLVRTLEKIDRHTGVIGSCLIGCNGMPIASNLPPDYDAELVGMYFLGLYTQTKKVNELLGNKDLPAIILLADKGYSVIANCGLAFLICLTEEQDATPMTEILQKIWSVIREG